MKNEITGFLKKLQDDICKALIDINVQSYREDEWDRPGGGGGRTRVFEGGKFLEKGGVNFSEVYGDFNPDFAKTIPFGDGTSFYATGVSLVLHPTNPFVPTVHANFRYLERGSSGWFGGGVDLTPVYPFLDDVKHFHQTWAKCLAPFGKDTYQKFKEECDKYFFLPHRNESRGVGGIFFDYQQKTPENYEMWKTCAENFCASYIPIVEKRMALPYNEENKNFQEYRRGRYVEFNLIYDRGTIFGLKTNGRIESILMSLPKKAQWWYDYHAEEGSPEAALQDFLRPRDWLNEN